MSDKFGMTSHKLLWHLDRLNSWTNGKRIVPLHIQLGITNVCNLACKYCYGDLIGKVDAVERFDMPKESIITLFEDAKEVGVKSIALVGEGENTLSPHFYDALECARNLDLDLGIATNGLAFNHDRIKEILESFVWIRFNLSSATRESYKIIHGKDQFYRIMNVISKCVDEKVNHRLNTTLGLQMVVIEDNIDQIILLAKLGEKLGVDYFVAKPCSESPEGTLGIYHKMYADLEDVFKQAENFSTSDYSVIMKHDKFANLGNFEFTTCNGTCFIIAIDAHGNVAPCGHLLGHKADEFRMGNILEQSLKDIIKSDRYWEVQSKVQLLDVVKECETNCLHSRMNIFLEKLLNPPDHINFV